MYKFIADGSKMPVNERLKAFKLIERLATMPSVEGPPSPKDLNYEFYMDRQNIDDLKELVPSSCVIRSL